MNDDAFSRFVHFARVLCQKDSFWVMGVKKIILCLAKYSSDLRVERGKPIHNNALIKIPYSLFFCPCIIYKFCLFVYVSECEFIIHGIFLKEISVSFLLLLRLKVVTIHFVYV